jgi:hypothetical protein
MYLDYISTVAIKSSGWFGDTVKAIAFLLLQVHAIFGAWLYTRTEKRDRFQGGCRPYNNIPRYIPTVEIKSSGCFSVTVKAIAFLLLQVHAIFVHKRVACAPSSRRQYLMVNSERQRN